MTRTTRKTRIIARQGRKETHSCEKTETAFGSFNPAGYSSTGSSVDHHVNFDHASSSSTPEGFGVFLAIEFILWRTRTEDAGY
jgi:hypothetical protein